MKKVLLISVLIFVFLTGCSVLPGVSPSDKNIEITDTSGHAVTLEDVPDRIAIAGKATLMVQDAIYLFEEAVQKVIALENRNQSVFSFLPVVDPGIAEKEIFEKNVGPEQIAAAQTDLVIMKSSMIEKLGEPLEQLGIPVVYLDLETPEVFYRDIAVLGQVFGNSNRADEIIDFYQDRVSRIEELVSGVSPDQRPTVLMLEYSDKGGEVAFSVPPVSWLQTTIVEIAGGSPVWKSLEISGGWTVVNLEQIAAWDPDQIFIIDYSGNAAAVKADLITNPIWSNLRAVQENQLFAFAYDFYSWDQPDTRWILGLQWLATKIHPDLTAEIDIMEEVNSFYSDLYNLEPGVIDAEVLPILTGDLP
ncbi:MAG: ABC transporter substrate-binding protein [Anaerolineales bacterium]|nr:ABC transporter substrate-binding protein [Anaerolineales bacterium]